LKDAKKEGKGKGKGTTSKGKKGLSEKKGMKKNK